MFGAREKCLIRLLSRSVVFTQCEFEILSLELLKFVLAEEIEKAVSNAEDFVGTAGCKSPRAAIAGGCPTTMKKFIFVFWTQMKRIMEI